MLIHTRRLRLMTMELAHLAAIVRGPGSLGDLLGVTIPDGWPVYPAAFPHALALLRREPHRPFSGWWLYLFVDPAKNILVGCGGFREAPDVDGVVEIGGEIAPSLRRQGFATEALRGLINYACTRPEVNAIDANSQAAQGAQSGLLRAIGMARIGKALDSKGGRVWHWRVTSDAFVASRCAELES
jgi:RimJ/RimL family protein N-acetyltransferase